ncbi:TonB-dependent siderophore receptor [Bosea sp. (in: a-proteobacteria)]
MTERGHATAGQRAVVHGARQHLASLLLSSTILGCAILSVPSVAHSQQASGGAATGQSLNFAIPAQSLSSAVNAFSRAAGWQVGFPATLNRGTTTRPVSGMMSPQQALQTMLAGTGIRIRITGARSAALVDPSVAAVDTVNEGSLLLDTINVQGQSENAWGPVDGYIATRSATGTKSDTAIMETPQTINVVARDQMDAQHAQTLNQAARYSSGVKADGHGDVTRFDQFSFRGIATVTDNNQFLDGLRLPRGTSYLIAQVDAWNIERLELLKGPASVLYGHAPLAGIINSVSKRPTENPFAEAEVLFGSHERKRVAFDIGGPLNSDGTLLYRLNGVGLDSNTSVDHTKEQRISLAPSLTWKPSADTSLTILALYQRDPKGGYYGFLAYRGTVVPTAYGRLPRNFFDGSPLANEYDRTQAAIGYSFQHRFSEDWSIQQNARFLHMDLDQSLVYSMAMLPDNRTLARLSQWSREKMKAFNVDTNIQGKFDTGAITHKVVFGVDYQWDNWKQMFGYGAAPSLDWLNPNYALPIPRAAASSTPNRTETLLGLYAQDQLKIGNLSILLGGRYDWANIDNKNASTRQYTQQDIGKFTYRVGAIYNFENGLAPYASYSTSFDPTVTANAYGAPFKPTTGEQVEAGLKYQPSGFKGLFTLSAYDLTQQNVLTRDPTPGAPINRYVQTGEVRSRGIEFEARLNPMEGLNIIGSFAWIDPEVTKSNGTDLGRRPVNVAQTLASFWADYTIQNGSFSGLTIGGGVRHVGSTFADPDNTLKVSSYFLADATFKYDFGRIDHKLKGLSASLSVLNIFDKTYEVCNAANACNYGQGRTVLGSLKYRW